MMVTISNKFQSPILHTIGQTNRNISEEWELLCICPSNKGHRLETCSTTDDSASPVIQNHVH
jgi:hypothetical protein